MIQSASFSLSRSSSKFPTRILSANSGVKKGAGFSLRALANAPLAIALRGPASAAFKPHSDDFVDDFAGAGSEARFGGRISSNIT